MSATSSGRISVALEIYYFSKEIRGPVIYRYYKKQSFVKSSFLRVFFEKAQTFSSIPYNF